MDVRWGRARTGWNPQDGLKSMSVLVASALAGIGVSQKMDI